MATTAAFMARARAGEFQRVVAFGSSNTERRSPGMHWFDLLGLAFHQQVGPQIACINAGRGGDTTVDLLGRMERDCLFYRPALVILTVGGNDANPERGVTPEQFEANLHKLITAIHAQGGQVVLQTYYAADLEAMEPLYADAFTQRMNVVRTVAAEAGCLLVDHLARWERLRLGYPELYRGFLLDPLHLNEAGNLLLGADLVRAFGLEAVRDPKFAAARVAQTLLDELGFSRG